MADFRRGHDAAQPGGSGRTVPIGVRGAGQCGSVDAEVGADPGCHLTEPSTPRFGHGAHDGGGGTGLVEQDGVHAAHPFQGQPVLHQDAVSTGPRARLPEAWARTPVTAVFGPYPITGRSERGQCGQRAAARRSRWWSWNAANPVAIRSDIHNAAVSVRCVGVGAGPMRASTRPITPNPVNPAATTGV